MRTLLRLQSMAWLLAAGALLSSCRAKAPVTAAPVPVRVQTVSRSAAVAGQRYSASIRPDAQVDLAFKVGGYVEHIMQVTGADGRRRNLQDGDLVRKGTVLARLRDTEYRDQLAEAQASLTQARSDYERTARMYENNTAAKADYDAAYARAQASQARYDQAALTVSDCALSAAMDGQVIRRQIEIGTLVSPGAPAFALADMRAVKAVFGVPDVAVVNIAMGDTLTVRTEAFPARPFRGQVTRIAPSADASSRIFEVECTIPNPQNELRSGMIAALQVGGRGGKSSGTLVPLNAIVRPKDDPQGYAVFIVETQEGKSVARIRPVQLGDVFGNSIAVTEGLQGGEQVVVIGATLVVDQQEVHIVP